MNDAPTLHEIGGTAKGWAVNLIVIAGTLVSHDLTNNIAWLSSWVLAVVALMSSVGYAALMRRLQNLPNGNSLVKYRELMLKTPEPVRWRITLTFSIHIALSLTSATLGWWFLAALWMVVAVLRRSVMMDRRAFYRAQISKRIKEPTC